ncbi:2-dehydropantoate 2-reductase [Edaphobacter bradus]|uniref:2-dehydropantoate 2-reductase n=1 Tax=Edaphobacter bradus TaxID=2259016 RepID=UPI0021E04BCE|nr:2-dehydropantoate 2-reductase [Edaphobacter bradus]
MARIAIVGVGAIGGVVASLLQSTGKHELVLCVHRPLRELVVETPSGPMRIDATVITDPAEAQAVDWVMVATKVYDVAGAATWLNRLCAKGAPVAVVQNGVEHRERFAPYVPIDRIVPVIVDCPAERRSPELIVQRGPMSLKVSDSAPGGEFVALFRGSAADAMTVPDWVTVAWRKLCHNAAGVLSALVLQPNSVMRDDAIGEVALEIVRECIAVGRAEGAKLGDAVPDEVLAAYRRLAPDGINSLHADLMEGRAIEIDARNGVIVRLGRKHGIPTPYNGMAVALLEAMAKKKTWIHFLMSEVQA